MTARRKATITTSLRPIGQAARPVIKKILPKNSEIFQQLFDLWPDLVGGTENEGAIPEKLVFPRGQQSLGILYLWTKTGSQAAEMAFSKAVLIRKINTVFGFTLVLDLRLTAYPTALKQPESAGKTVKMAPRVSCQSLDKMLSGISNPVLKTLLLDLGSTLESQSYSETGDLDA